MSLKERGVAVLLAENAETIEPTAKNEITNILAEMVPSKISEIPCLFWD
jgi:hypothetical protein